MTAAFALAVSAGLAMSPASDAETSQSRWAPLVVIHPRPMKAAQLLAGQSDCQVSFQIDNEGAPQFIRAQCQAAIDTDRIRSDLAEEARRLVAAEFEHGTRRAVRRWRYHPNRHSDECMRLTFSYPSGSSTPRITEESNALPCGHLQIDY